MLKDSEEKDEAGGGVKSDARDIPIRATTREDINALLEYGYEVNDDRLPTPQKKQAL